MFKVCHQWVTADVCLNLQNGHDTNPYCQGIDGVLQAYYQTLQRVQLYGPTNFSPVINHVARFVVVFAITVLIASEWWDVGVVVWDEVQTCI